jgi:hypothetical protein
MDFNATQRQKNSYDFCLEHANSALDLAAKSSADCDDNAKRSLAFYLSSFLLCLGYTDLGKLYFEFPGTVPFSDNTLDKYLAYVEASYGRYPHAEYQLPETPYVSRIPTERPPTVREQAAEVVLEAMNHSDAFLLEKCVEALDALEVKGVREAYRERES